MGNKVGLKYLPSSPVNHHIPRGRKKNQDRSTFQYWYMSGRMFSRMSERRYSDFLMKDGIKYTFPSKIDLTNESLGKLLARAVRYSGFFGVRSVGISPLEMFLGNMSLPLKIGDPSQFDKTCLVVQDLIQVKSTAERALLPIPSKVAPLCVGRHGRKLHEAFI